MQEFQLVEIYREGWAVFWAQLQWWASVSFGLLALASFGRKHLSLAVTVGLTVLYALFSIFCVLNIFVIGGTIGGAVAELEGLERVSNVGGNILGAGPTGDINGLIATICFLATFCGTLTYLWYSYRKNVHVSA